MTTTDHRSTVVETHTIVYDLDRPAVTVTLRGGGGTSVLRNLRGHGTWLVEYGEKPWEATLILTVGSDPASWPGKAGWVLSDHENRVYLGEHLDEVLARMIRRNTEHEEWLRGVEQRRKLDRITADIRDLAAEFNRDPVDLARDIVTHIENS